MRCVAWGIVHRHTCLNTELLMVPGAIVYYSLATSPVAIPMLVGIVVVSLALEMLLLMVRRFKVNLRKQFRPRSTWIRQPWIDVRPSRHMSEKGPMVCFVTLSVAFESEEGRERWTQGRKRRTERWKRADPLSSRTSGTASKSLALAAPSPETSSA